jgi:hypothetical protein
MIRKKTEILKIMMALWIYLNQPLFRPETALSPIKFSLVYRQKLLERCFTKQDKTEEQRLFLERCWQRSCKIL